ncbi:MAG: alanine--tRNA ligase, partial [Candidatus Omnitrophota bacterium]|nr:alanine--tRNA ligase [Candidatus Omnitrophota bacterium]
KNIDTGMGLERLAAVMQGVTNNFETDLFQPIIKEIKGTVPANSYGTFSVKALNQSSSMESVPPMKNELTYAIADHIRAIVFAIYDGVLPLNEGRGYVVRKIIRKASLHLRALGVKKPFLYKLVPVLAQTMKAAYPDLENRRENISGIILAEEKNFISTLESSDNLFAEKFAGFRQKPDPLKVGVAAFALYDTYGIPFEITRDWLDKQGIKILEDAFNRELKAQKERSKSQSAMKGDVFSAKNLDLGIGETKFLGYKENQAKAKVLKIIKDAAEVKEISSGEEAAIILDKTPFYGESGGQVGDTGQLIKGKNKFAVLDTKRSGKVMMHLGQVKDGIFKQSDLVSAKIDRERRLSIMRNHTATHLLQAALRKVLGPHVRQQGSLVAPERLRFDFTHFKDITPDELERIEEVVNKSILADYALAAKEMSLAQAKKSGALAFFGEKYADKVRVVAVSGLSKELCGGTHLKKTGEIGLFKITQEGTVASGTRRIEAVTADFARQFAKEQEQKNIREAQRQKELTRLKELEKQRSLEQISSLQEAIPRILGKGEKINQINAITAVEDNLDMDALRRAMDMLKAQTNNAVIALGSQDNAAHRAFLVIGITPDLLAKGLDASALIRQVAKFIGGSGGGRKDFAQAGGNQPENFNQAFAELKNIVGKL